MADAVTATTVQDGPKKAVIYCTNTSDGSGESAVVKVDVSALASLQDGTAQQRWHECQTSLGCIYGCYSRGATGGLFRYFGLLGHERSS
jgi:hypothetical protein